MTNILLVEDDSSFVHLIKTFLEKKGYALTAGTSLKDARDKLTQQSYRLILLDFHLPDGNAFDFLSHLHQQDIRIPVVIMTSFQDVRTAVKAMRLGIRDYITKPVNPEELLMIVEQTLKKSEAPAPSEIRQEAVFVKGVSKTSEELHRHIELIAPTNMSVIIQGESGTGKENLARSIHQLSKRSHGPFIAIDCGALSDELASSELFGHVKGAFTGAMFDKKGEFAAADGGTLFLDEVGNLSYNVQVKLLRAIQERIIQPVGGNKPLKVDVRIITATNDDLKISVRNGAFREDLFHRLNEFSIYVPPLRERAEDLALFTDHFIARSNKELSKQVKGVSPEVMEIFLAYKWPGNLRELQNIMKRSVLLAQGDLIQKTDIPDEMYQPGAETPRKPETDLKLMNETNEKELIIKTLQDVRFNKTKAAALLNIDRKTLYLKIMKYGIDG
jgi:two-component system response regulator HydG